MKKVTLLLIVLVFVVSSVTLWLLESPLKPMLYFFEAALILTIYYSLYGNFKKISFEIKEKQVTKLGFRWYYIDYFLAMCVISLLLLNISGLTNNYLGAVLSVIVALYVPGWALVRITSIFANLKGVEILVLPFVLSIPISSLMFSIFLANQHIDKFPFLLAYFIFSILPPIKAILKHEERHSIRTVFIPFSALNLIWLAAFFSFVILITYPQMAFVPGLDIVRHFSSARQLMLAPAAYHGSELWFHIHQICVYMLSESSMQIFQTTTAFLSIFSVLSFYLMSKAYLNDIDERLPALATLFWGVFSGFGWLYFLGQRIINPDISAYYNLLYDTSNRSYWDVGYGQGWIWLWYRPLTLGLTLFFTLLYLLRNHKLSKRTFMFAFTLLLLALNFVHFSESVVFVLFLLVLSLFKPMKELRLNEAATSSAIAMLISLPLLLTYQNAAHMAITAPPPNQLMLLTVASAFSILLTRFSKRPTIKSWSVIRWLISGLSLIYIWLLVTWLMTAKDFSTAYVAAPVYGVPWQFYPMLLGISGLLAILSSQTILNRYSKHPIIAFLILLPFTILFGRLLTYYNINIGDIGYWERRIVPIAYAAACVLAPISIVELFKHAQKKKTAIVAVLLAFLVILGITSTFLTIEYRVHTTEKYVLSDDDLEVVNRLDELSADKVLLTVTSGSRSVAEFSPSSWLINYYRYQLWPAKYPELPLNVLYSMNKPVYILLREADVQEINQKYASCYLATHSLPMFMSNNLNDNVSIISLPKMTAPSSNSQTLLVIPNYQDSAVWYAYDMLSQANCNYSTVLIDDIAAISKAKTLIAPTEDVALQLIAYRDLFNLKFDNLVVLNLNGYGNLAANYFSSPKMTLSLDKESKEIANLNSGIFSADNITVIAAPLEFEIRSKYDIGNFFILLDDNFDGWVASGIGSGNISLPELSLNYENKVSGNASIGIDVESGKFAYWQLAKSFSEPINFSDFDFISFYWYGKGDEKNYVLNFHSGPSNNYWYYFKDTWHGWKKVMIPMRIPDGRYDLNEVSFVKATNGKPTWSNIVRVEIRNEGSNPNLSGTFLIDNFGFESALTINVNLITQASVKAFRLFNYNGTSWTSITELTSNETVSIPNFTLMNGMDSKIMFGERILLNVTMTKKPVFSTITISIRLPPYLGDIYSSSVKMKITPEIPRIKVSEILGPNGSLSLITEPYAIPLTTYKDVVSWYRGKEGATPFTISDNVDRLEIIYVNVYPLVTDTSFNKSNYEILGKILDILDTDHLFPKAQLKAENPVQGNLATFDKVDFEGCITIYSDSSVIIRSRDSTLTLRFNNNEMIGVSKIMFAEEKVTLKMRNGNLSGGEGFYSHIYSNELTANSNDTTIGVTLLEFDNGTVKIINVPAHEAKVTGDSVTVLRQPTIQAEGNVKFDKLYTYAFLSKALGILGYDASLQGKLNFKVIFGDTFTVANSFIYVGQITSTHEKYNYNELDALKQSFLMLVIICLLYLTIYTLREPATSVKSNKYKLKKADI